MHYQRYSFVGEGAEAPKAAPPRHYASTGDAFTLHEQVPKSMLNEYGGPGILFGCSVFV